METEETTQFLRSEPVVSEASSLCLWEKPVFMVPKTNEKIQIVIDDGERLSGVIEELEKALAVVVKIEPSTGRRLLPGGVLSPPSLVLLGVDAVNVVRRHRAT